MDIDWSKAPEGATHYDLEAELFVSKDSIWVDGKENARSRKAILASFGRYIPRPTKPAAPEWGGETFIQVGHRLQARVNDNPWLSGEITYRSDSGVVFRPDDGGDELFWRFALFDVEFRPLRTKEQRERDDLAGLIDDAQMSLGRFWTPQKAAEIILSRYNLEPKYA